MESEVQYLNSDITLFTYLHLAGNPSLAKKLIDTGVRGIAYETVTSPDNTFPLLAPMSAIAGQIAFNVGNYFLLKQNKGRGVLIGTLDGLDLGLVTIIGCGVAGEESLRKAINNRVEVNLIDLSEQRLSQLKSKYGDEKINYIVSTPDSIAESITDSDLILGSVYSLGKNAPKVVTDNMLDTVKPGAVMVDISIDQGGCFETSSPTTHDDPTFLHKGIVHYCVTNMPGAVPLTATLALNKATLSYITELADKGIQKALEENEHFLFSDKAFYCDFAFYHHMKLLKDCAGELLDNYPKIIDFCETFEKLRGIDDYLKNRPSLIGIGKDPKLGYEGHFLPTGYWRD